MLVFVGLRCVELSDSQGLFLEAIFFESVIDFRNFQVGWLEERNFAHTLLDY
jgi:hypothetical protein